MRICKMDMVVIPKQSQQPRGLRRLLQELNHGVLVLQARPVVHGVQVVAVEVVEVEVVVHGVLPVLTQIADGVVVALIQHLVVGMCRIILYLQCFVICIEAVLVR